MQCTSKNDQNKPCDASAVQDSKYCFFSPPQIEVNKVLEVFEGEIIK